LDKLLSGGNEIHGHFQAYVDAARSEGELHSIGADIWAISYPSCEWLMREKAIESAGTYTEYFGGRASALAKLQESWLETSRGSTHEARRSISNRAFRDKALNSHIIRRIPEIIGSGLERIGIPFQGDFVSAYSTPIGDELILEWVGIPADLHEPFMEAAHRVGLTVGAKVDDDDPSIGSASAALEDILPAMLKLWRSNSMPIGLMAALRAANVSAGAPLTDLEGVSCVLNFAFNAELFEPLISNVVMELLSEASSEVWALDSGTVDTLVYEVVRLATPSPLSLRQAVEDIKYKDTHISSGQWIVLYMAAALRDPHHFSRAGAVDLNRGGTPFAFGAGSHTCLGGRMALQVAKSVLTILWSRYTVQLDGAIQWVGGPYRGVRQLPLYITRK